MTHSNPPCVSGTNTEIGQGQADIMADRATASVSVFEQRVMVGGPRKKGVRTIRKHF